jgi:hypothetical protein
VVLGVDVVAPDVPTPVVVDVPVGELPAVIGVVPPPELDVVWVPPEPLWLLLALQWAAVSKESVVKALR